MSTDTHEILRRMDEAEKCQDEHIASQEGGTIKAGIDYIREFSNDIADWFQCRENQIVMIHIGINKHKAHKRLAKLHDRLSRSRTHPDES